MWAKLKKHYEGKGHSLKSQYMTEIKGLDYSEFDDIIGFVVQFQRLKTAIEQVGMELPNDWYPLARILAPRYFLGGGHHEDSVLRQYYR
jgi:hypothetical protein